jgi:type IV secretory pathway VirB2 component (pilin)
MLRRVHYESPLVGTTHRGASLFSRSVRMPFNSATILHRLRWRIAAMASTVANLTIAVDAQATSPWERAAANLEFTFTGPLAGALALVAIVIGGLMFMFGEGGAKRQISGIVFGGGLALFAAQFLAWLF